VTVTAPSGIQGAAVITLQVSDPDEGQSEASFLVVAGVLNHAPSLSGLTDLTAVAGASTAPLAFTVSDDFTDPALVIVTASSGDEARLPLDAIFLGGSGADRTIRFTPPTDATGPVVVTLRALDTGGEYSEGFLTVSIVPPSGPHITSIAAGPEGISITFETVAGLPYTVEYQDALSAPDWNALPAVLGTGETVTLTDPAPLGASRFYRLRSP
jgi:hypothetical protein